MKHLIYTFILLLMFNNSIAQNSNKWIMGYLPTYTQAGDGSIPYLTDGDFQKVTHVLHLGPYVNQNGTLDFNANQVTAIKMQNAVLRSHSLNRPILLSFQAWYDNYIPAISTQANRDVLTNNLLSILDTYNYDGIDIDLEPVISPYVSGIQTSNPNYVLLVNQIADSLSVRTSAFLQSKPLLACAINPEAAVVLNSIQSQFDMINIMTYDMAGAYPGWVVWHDSAIYNGGHTFPSTGGPLPSINEKVQYCLDQGISSSKLGIGISFDAFRWRGGTLANGNGVSQPRDAYITEPSFSRFSYSDMMQYFYNQNAYHFDSEAQMAYMSKDLPGSADDEFWSFNDGPSCVSKVEFLKQKNLGGLIVWELHSGYIPNALETNPQLTAIYNAINSSTLSINEASLKTTQIYPNPITSNYLMLSSIKNKKLEIALFDISGKLLVNQTFTTSQNGDVNISAIIENIENGIYILKIQNSNKIENFKLIINK